MRNYDRYKPLDLRIGTKRTRPLIVAGLNPNIAISHLYRLIASSPDSVSGSSSAAVEVRSESNVDAAWSNVAKFLIRPELPIDVASGKNLFIYLYSHARTVITYTFSPQPTDTQLFVDVRLTPVIAEFDWDTEASWNGSAGLTYGTTETFRIIQGGEGNGASGPGCQAFIGESAVTGKYPLGFRLAGEDETVYGVLVEIRPTYTGGGTPILQTVRMSVFAAGDGRNFFRVFDA